MKKYFKSKIQLYLKKNQNFPTFDLIIALFYYISSVFNDNLSSS